MARHDRRLVVIVERRYVFIRFIAENDRSALALETGIVKAALTTCIKVRKVDSIEQSKI